MVWSQKFGHSHNGGPRLYRIVKLWNGVEFSVRILVTDSFDEMTIMYNNQARKRGALLQLPDSIMT